MFDDVMCLFLDKLVRKNKLDHEYKKRIVYLRQNKMNVAEYYK